MKKFDSRAYSINDFLEWHDKGQLELSPKFQRNYVWSDTAKSYLIDTIVRGKPIPKIFIRQKINTLTKSSIREVVDGQQRLRTIISYLKDGFQISKKHHPLYGGLFFSQLSDMPDDIQTSILNYELSVDLLVNMPDEEILDVFSRLNSYAVLLNEQEKINASHFGPFKTLCDRIAHQLNSFWIKNEILTEQKILRMDDANLVSDLLIAATAGIKSKKQIKPYYSSYEDDFPFETEEIFNNFMETISSIQHIFNDGLAASEFKRVHIFYTLFTSIYHCLYGIQNINQTLRADIKKNPERTRSLLDHIDSIFKANDHTKLSRSAAQFLADSRRATTDSAVRIRRTEYLLQLLKDD